MGSAGECPRLVFSCVRFYKIVVRNGPKGSTEQDPFGNKIQDDQGEFVLSCGNEIRDKKML